MRKEINHECWDCICLDIDLEAQTFFCEKGLDYQNKPKDQELCPGYVWNEVGYPPWPNREKKNP